VKLELRGDNEHPFDPRESSDDLLDHSIGEIFLLGIVNRGFWKGKTAIDGFVRTAQALFPSSVRPPNSRSLPG